ncbi:MAG: hypothetical protein U0793_18460 [Gemmataceae bacterium]
MLLAWIDAGCPAEAWPPAPTFAGYLVHRQAGRRSHHGRAFEVPAKAPKECIKYQYFIVPTNFEEDRWIQAAEAPAGQPPRHPPHHRLHRPGRKKASRRGRHRLRFLVAYVPGDAGVRFPAGMAKKIPKGASLLRCTTRPTASPGDKSSVGVVFAKEPPSFEMKTKAIAQQLFLIPPGAGNHKVDSKATFKQDAASPAALPPHAPARQELRVPRRNA